MDLNQLAAIDKAIAPLPVTEDQPSPPKLLVLKYGAGKPLIVSVGDPDAARRVVVLVASPPVAKSGFFGRRKTQPNYRANIEYGAGLHAAVSRRLAATPVAVVVVQDLSLANAAGELSGLVTGLEATNEQPPVRIALVGHGDAGTAIANSAQQAGLGVRHFLGDAQLHPDVASAIAAK